MPLFTDVEPQLFFDGLNLLGFNEHEGGEFVLEVEGDDATWGNPQPVDVWVTSMLMDGAIVYTQRHDNREGYLRVKVSAGDATGLQAGEDALMQACGKRTTLEWTPPQGDAATVVFKVETAHLEHIFDDFGERRTDRVYGLRFVAQPFTRSVDKIRLTAIPDGVAFTETVIDEATSTTGWTGKGAVSLVSGQAVRSTLAASGDTENWLLRTGSVTITQPYIRLKGGTNVPLPSYMKLVVGGVSYYPTASMSGNYWFAVPAGTYPSIKIVAELDKRGNPTYTGTWLLTAWSLYQTNSTTFGSRRETSRTFNNILGSVRAPGDLIISHPTNGLGDVLAFVYPDSLEGYSPPLNQWRTGGGTQTSTPGNISGQREPLNGTPTWTVPTENLPPGGYHLMARLRHTSAVTIDVTVTAFIAGSESISRTVKVAIDAVSTWQTSYLTTLPLPPALPLPGTSGDVVITLTTATAGVELDTAWVFFASEYDHPTALIQVAAGSEKTVTYRIADVGQPSDVVYVGNFAGGAKVVAMDTPNMQPPAANIYIAATGTDDPEGYFDYYPHWGTHPGV